MTNMACNMFADLPNSGKLPLLGYGTWNGKDEALTKALNYALECGYRHIDTAFAYENEHIIGNILKDWISKGKLKREDLFITTKLPPIGIHPDKVDDFMKKSLASLQLDYVDLYLMHCPCGVIYDETTQKMTPDLNSDFVATWKKMEEQVDQKRAKYIGISNFNMEQIGRVLKSCRIKPANLQIEFHAYLQQPELINYCKKQNISVVAYCPLGNPSFGEVMKKHNIEKRDLPVLMDDPIVKKIAKKHSKTAAQILLRHIMQNGISAIPKSVTPSRILENFTVFDFTLDADDMKQMNALNKAFRISDWKFFGLEAHPEHPFKEEINIL